MKLNTRIENSPRKFDVSIENLMQNEIALDHLSTKNDFNRISCHCQSNPNLQNNESIPQLPIPLALSS